jgi:hypothetical protein
MIGNQKTLLGITVLAAIMQFSCAPAGNTCKKQAQELCEGIDQACDNNDDGVVDEGCPNGSYLIECHENDRPRICVNSPVGACATNTGLQKCEKGRWASCEGARKVGDVTEICGNNIDDNCADGVDENCECVPGTFQACGSGVGECRTGKQECGEDHRWKSECVGEVKPTLELCDGKDNDCNGQVDDSPKNAPRQFKDADGDGYGDVNVFVDACTPPPGYVSQAGDCNDGNTAVHPGALELCDGVDNNCDGILDPDTALDAPTFYLDLDGDGFGTAAVPFKRSCSQPFGYVANLDDCNDADPAVHPGAVEVCNGKDDNCDGQTDPPGSAGAATFYPDTDHDGYGVLAGAEVACSAPAGFVANHDDCDDTKAAVHPGAVEICGDGIDNNCDPSDDDQGITHYADTDGDGFGDPLVTRKLCVSATGWVLVARDCDDAERLINPNATEVCDGKDNNCDGVIDEAAATDAHTYHMDLDGDGFGSATNMVKSCTQPARAVVDGTDCDDTRSDIHPGATETCDGVDNNCDGHVDEATAANAPSWFFDGDRDGYGNPLSTVKACAQPAFYVALNTDCDDGNAAIHLGATEVCDGVDNDCDGNTDPTTSVGAPRWYPDSDGDNFGVGAVTIPSCTKPAGFSAVNTDCNDNDATIHPGAQEICGNGIDDNCYPADDLLGSPVYRDADGDGFGDANNVRHVCAPLTGFVPLAGDCDDTRASVNPNAAEVCNGRDDNCDGTIDEPTATDATTYHRDADGDTYGSITATVKACTQPQGYVLDGTDCRDDRSDVHPGATEVCDSLDNNCDGNTDEATAADAKTWYFDGDRDTHGTVLTQTKACAQPPFYVALGDDCDDGSANVHPGATEVCNGVDDNCDGLTDPPTSVGAPTWYRDVDADGYGIPGTTTVACVKPAGYSAVSTDCNDGNPAINPGAQEVCGDGIDNNCNPADDLTGSTLYRDVDGDGYGLSSTTVQSCVPVTGYVTLSGDCDDTNAAIHPGATEMCNGVDDNCDGTVDEATSANAGTYYRDADGDSYGLLATSVKACTQPAGYVPSNTDCNDTRSDVHPGAAEVCNGVDDNCDGITDPSTSLNANTYYLDADHDGFGTSLISQRACAQPQFYVPDSQDCNDGNAAINSNATEVCDGVDNNCDGITDPVTSVGAPLWYEDLDGDHYGTVQQVKAACVQPVGFAANATDCNDANASINPGMAEVCGDGIDNDCNPANDVNGTVWHRDVDGDGFGSLNQTQQSCTQPASYIVDGTDCNDTNANIHPGAVEICGNLVDDNCNGLADENCGGGIASSSGSGASTSASGTGSSSASGSSVGGSSTSTLPPSSSSGGSSSSAGSSSGGGAVSDQVTGELAKVSCTGNTGARPGCLATDMLCRRTVHVQVRGLIFPSNEWVNGGSMGLIGSSVKLVYEAGQSACGVTTFCEATDTRYTPGFTMDFWGTMHQRFKLVTKSTFGTSYDPTFGTNAWIFDPTVPLASERCTTEVDASGTTWLIIN